MAQVVVWGLHSQLESRRAALSDAIHAAVMSALDYPADSVEITITETPRVNWGIRGQNAADLALNYSVEV